MGNTLGVRHRPSNAMLWFTFIPCVLALWLICWPAPVRDHTAMDWLDPINLKILGWSLIAVALFRMLADAMVWKHARLMASCLMVGFFLTVLVGVMLYDPSWSATLWMGWLGFEVMLALRWI